MARYITVRVVDSSGRPYYNEKVSVECHRTLATGFVPDQSTDREGVAQFSVDDNMPEISIFVKGRKVVDRDSVRAQYQVVI